MHRLFTTLFAILCVFSTGFAVTETKITADDAEAGDGFGYSVSIDGDYAIVGAWLDDDAWSNSGSAYIFVRDGDNWVQQAKLTAEDAAEDDHFGISVSIDGNRAIVGSSGNDDDGDNSGSAYFFEYDGESWIQQAKLTAEDAQSQDYFGYAVSLDGDYAIISAYSNRQGGFLSGSAYIFVRNDNNWAQQAKLVAEDAAREDLFGSSVSISGDFAIIGAPGNDDRGLDSGSAYLFARDGDNWTQQDKLTANDGRMDDSFGNSVGLDGDYAVIGAAFNDENGGDSGSAYVFVRDGEEWVQQAKLTADDAAREDYFGNSVTIDGNYVMIGSTGDDDGAHSAGSAYIFIRDGENWTQDNKLNADDAAEEDRFGHALAIDGDHFLVSALYDDDNGNSSGSAYVYYREDNRVEPGGKLTIFPSDYYISTAYPNPFNSTVNIPYGLPADGRVTMQVFDVYGRLIETIIDRNCKAGKYVASWQADNVSTGIYLVKFKSDRLHGVEKIVLTR